MWFLESQRQSQLKRNTVLRNPMAQRPAGWLLNEILWAPDEPDLLEFVLTFLLDEIQVQARGRCSMGLPQVLSQTAWKSHFSSAQRNWRWPSSPRSFKQPADRDAYAQAQRMSGKVHSDGVHCQNTYKSTSDKNCHPVIRTKCMKPAWLNRLAKEEEMGWGGVREEEGRWPALSSVGWPHLRKVGNHNFISSAHLDSYFWTGDICISCEWPEGSQGEMGKKTVGCPCFSHIRLV